MLPHEKEWIEANERIPDKLEINGETEIHFPKKTRNRNTTFRKGRGVRYRYI